MADIDVQLEANGLPTKFESTANQPEVSHATINAAATLSNSEIHEIKQNAPDLETSILNKPVLPSDSSIETSRVPETQPSSIQGDVAVTNGNLHLTEATTGSTLVTESDVKRASSPGIKPKELASQIDSSFNESFVPSSIPSEIQSSNTTAEVSQFPLDTMNESFKASDQAPLSDLRTEPHSDALSSEAVAKIEAEKHELDNNADVGSNVMDAPPSPQPAAEAPIVKGNGLPSPPAQSPPPAPEPAHAVLPSEPPAVLSVEEMSAIVPATQELPRDPAPTPIAAPPVSSMPTDMEMTDVASPAMKTAREREDDMDTDEPASKRFKTDESRQTSEQTEFKIPEIPRAASNEGSSVIVDEDDAVTMSRLQHMKKVISNLKKSNASTSFRLPVDPVALNLPTYFDHIKKPMDLGTIDNRLKRNEYSSVSDFIADFEQIVNNTLTFNGPEHGVTQQGFKMQNSFRNQMQHLPPISAAEPTKIEKKLPKTKIEPVRAAPRRTSMTATTPAKVKSPKAPAPVTTPAFAPGPDGVPLIRRDSNMADGRPKRAIVPPKRNSEFGGGRPKKKKYELQLRFCDEVLKNISSPKHWQLNQYFTHPVDPVALNIPTYFQVIKKPMDLGTVRTKLDNNVYEKAKDFEEDVRLVFRNCYKFNPEGDYVNNLGHQLEDLFSKEWVKKDDWIAAREPASEPASDVEDDQDEEEASEEDEETNSEDDRNDKIKILQAQIEAMSKQMGELTQKKKKKSTPPSAPKKKDKKAKKEKVATTFPNLKPKEKKKSSGSKSKPEKDRYVTFAEKQYISNGIAMLPERQMQEALKIIQNSVPSLANSDQNEIELDIEEVPNHALLKLLNFVKKYAGPPPDEPKAETESYSAPSVSKSKKHKPMSKSEQEAQIEELKGKLHSYAGPVSPDAVQSIETGADSSDDEADTEESEEE